MTVDAIEGAATVAPSSYIDDLYPYALAVASDLARRYSLVDVDDVAHEIYLYVLEHEKVLEEWNEYCSGDYIDSRDERHAANRMRLICRRAGERYCRKETADRLGYSPEDEAFYSVPVLKLLVEHYFVAGITERGPQDGDLGRQTASDPATRGTWLAALLDVERGLSRIPRQYRHRLKLRYSDHGGRSVGELVAMVDNLATPRGTRERIEKALGTTEDQIHGRIRVALEKLQGVLGGASPYGRDRLTQDEQAA